MCIWCTLSISPHLVAVITKTISSVEQLKEMLPNVDLVVNTIAGFAGARFSFETLMSDVYVSKWQQRGLSGFGKVLEQLSPQEK